VLFLCTDGTLMMTIYCRNMWEVPSWYITYRFTVRVCCVPGYLSRYSDSIQVGRSGDRVPVGGEIFPTHLDQSWIPPRLLYNGYWVYFPERGVDHPPPYSDEVKDEVQLYLYPNSGLSWPVIGWELPLPLLCAYTDVCDCLLTTSFNKLLYIPSFCPVLTNCAFEQYLSAVNIFR
jgi:hypothetical protein